jgi:thiamine pyrophosphate-dependent acetolactate synthase large subunit-like protein
MDLNGAELIARHLEAEGLTHVVGAQSSMGGGALLPLYRALADSRLVHVLAQHDRGAGLIAQGLARAGGRAGVCLTTAGAGVSSLLPAIADAQADAVPLVAICGCAPDDATQRHAPRTGYLVDAITKTHFEIRDVADLVDALPEAFRVAESGRPGAVVIEVPRHVQTARIRLATAPTPAARDPEPEAQDFAPRPQPPGAGQTTLICAVVETLGHEVCVIADPELPQTGCAPRPACLPAPRWLSSQALATSGFALPVAIGAALATADAPVVALCSAAGLLASLQELSTLVDLRLDLKLVVVDGEAPGLRPPQPFRLRRFAGSPQMEPPALCAIAEGFGLATVELALARDPRRCLVEALREPGPVLVRVPHRLAHSGVSESGAQRSSAAA